MLIEHISLPSRPDRDRSRTIGASEIGKCARALAHARSGTPKEFEHEQSGFAERGHWIERWWVAQIRSSPIGHRIRYAGSQQRTLSYGPLSATPDAVFDGRHTADCKSFDPRIHRLPKYDHVVQVRLTAGIARELGIIASEDCSGILNYVNASDFNDRREFVFPACTLDEIGSSVDRAHAILSATPNSLPREGWIAGGDECQECPFRSACLGEKIQTVADLPEQEATRVADLRARYECAKTAKEAAEKESRQCLDEILQILRTNRTRRAKGLAYIRRGVSAGGLDTEAMEADGIDLSLYRREGKPYETVVVEQEK